MTEQITIKLNKEKFEDILKDLREYGNNTFETNSSMAAFCIWFTYYTLHNKYPEVNKTNFEIMQETLKKSKWEIMFDNVSNFRKFCGKCPEEADDDGA
ncbi:TPA: hypothetical protein HA265_00625 [Candidatus Woesearchaeota archaeon]|nr:hypothetical protein [Candidatus Woesearchaeota archaeon]